MRKLILTISICIVSHSLFAQHLGLIAQLVELKHKTESQLVKYLSDEKLTANDKQSIAKAYGDVKLPIDMAIAQLMADMKQANSIRKYKKMNKYYVEHSLNDIAELHAKLQGFAQKFVEAETASKAFQNLSLERNKDLLADRKELIGLLENGMGVEKASMLAASELFEPISGAVLTAAELGWTIAQNVTETREKKVDGISAILTSVQLTPMKEFLTEKKKD